MDNAGTGGSPPARGRLGDGEGSAGAGDPCDRKTLEEALQILEAQAAARAPLVPVVMGRRAVRPLLGMHREGFTKRRDLMVWTDADEVDVIGHHWFNERPTSASPPNRWTSCRRDAVPPIGAGVACGALLDCLP